MAANRFGHSAGHDGASRSSRSEGRQPAGLNRRQEARRIRRFYELVSAAFDKREGNAPRFRHSTRYDGPHGKSGISLWERVAVFVEKSGVPATDYVYHILRKLSHTTREIYPEYLLGEKLMESYLRERTASDREELDRWKSQQVRFNAERDKFMGLADYAALGEDQKDQFAVFQLREQLSPLFVFFQAYRSGLAGLCRETRTGAALEYYAHTRAFDLILQEEMQDPDQFLAALLEGGESL